MKKVGDEVGYDNSVVTIERISPSGDCYLITTNDVGKYWISVDLAFGLKRIDRKEKIKKILNDNRL